MQEKRGEDLGDIVGKQSSSQYLFATRRVYHKLAELTCTSDVSDLLPIPYISTNASEGERSALEQDQRTAITEAQRMISDNGYKAVVTDQEEIAKAAAQKDITTVLLVYNPGSDTGLEEASSNLYHLNTCCKQWGADLSVLLSYGEPEEQTNPTVLFVDDEEHQRALVELELGEDYNVITSPDIVDAANLLSKGGIDIVVTDNHIKGHKATGVQFAEFMTKQYPGIPVVLRTVSSGEDLDIVKASSAKHGYRVIDKDIVTLMTAVEEELEKEKQPRILIVDETFLIGGRYESDLKRAGFTNIKTVDNETKAIELIQRGGIDLVITDLILDGSSSAGLHVLQQVGLKDRDEGSYTPVIFYTSNESKRVNSLAEQAGAYKVIVGRTREDLQILVDAVKESLEIKRRLSDKTTIGSDPFYDGTSDSVVAAMQARGERRQPPMITERRQSMITEVPENLRRRRPNSQKVPQ